jgi:hypothetical protein
MEIQDHHQQHRKLEQQLGALGISAPASFQYSATVHNVLPRSITASAVWRLNLGRFDERAT